MNSFLYTLSFCADSVQIFVLDSPRLYLRDRFDCRSHKEVLSCELFSKRNTQVFSRGTEHDSQSLSHFHSHPILELSKCCHGDVCFCYVSGCSVSVC